MVGDGIEVAANAVPAGQGRRGVPVPGDGLMPFGGLDGLFGAVVRPLDAGLAGEQPDLIGVVPQPAAERVAGVVAVVPVPVPVVGDAEGGGLVAALARLRQKLRVRVLGTVVVLNYAGPSGFESWLERDRVMILDFSPEVTAFSSQPFWLTWPDGRGDGSMFRTISPGWRTEPGSGQVLETVRGRDLPPPPPVDHRPGTVRPHRA